MAPNPVSTSQQSKRKSKKLRIAKDPELERLDSLPWNSAIPSEDPSSFLDGPDELEGGFLSLEEIDESEYVLKIPEPGSFSKKEKPIKTSELKKRKRSSEDGGSRDEVEVEDVSEENVEEKKVKKTKKKKKKKKAKKTQNNVESTAVSNGKDDVEGESVDESEFYAWNELRLHPLLMKSIYRLGFKEPTAIQKACIPAAAHQGKDIIGAAETGSGKTLAFGLPILQRLLEEQEKAANQLPENGAAVEKYASRGPLRALILAPTRELALQVTDHLKEVAQGTIFRVVPIVGGLSSEKQERLLRTRPEIIVGTPGRLWELMSGGENHLVELHSLSFFVLDEADRMIQSGHFRELESIIDMIRANSGSIEDSQITEKNVTVSSFQRKKRQTFVFSATIALSADFRKKLKRGSLQSKRSSDDELKSIETLSERAGMRTNTAIIDLTNASILANKLEESFIECREDDKDSYLYYILRLHGQGRTIVFCTSIAALRHISSLLGTLEVKVCPLHAQMQQRARLNAIDRFRKDEHGILVATDVAARGLDIPGVRMVVHYQLPHSAEVYVHRSGRTARASADGCSIALISPNERSKFGSLCKSFSKESFQRFPLEYCYMPEILKRVSLAHQIDKISQKDSKAKAKKTWLEKNAEAVELIVEENDSEEERVNSHKQKKVSSMHLKKLQQELKVLLSRPLQPDTLKHKYFAGAGVTPLMQHQLQELSRQKLGEKGGVSGEGKRRKVVVIGQESSVDAVEALRSGGQEVSMDTKQIAEKRRNMEVLRKKRKEEKKRLHDQKRKQKKRLKGMD